MRRRDFAISLLLAGGSRSVRAQEPAKQHRIAIVEVSSAASIDDPGSRLWQPFWTELRRLGDAEGQNLVVERYSVEGRPESDVDLAQGRQSEPGRDCRGHRPQRAGDPRGERGMTTVRPPYSD